MNKMTLIIVALVLLLAFACLDVMLQIEEDFFWCHCLSTLIHPVGWSQTVGHRLKATPGGRHSLLYTTRYKAFSGVLTGCCIYYCRI